MGLLGCASRRGATEVRSLNSTLLGSLQPAREQVAVGEELSVDVMLRNISARQLSADVADRDESNPDRPFRSFSFNAVLEHDRNTPLELVFLGALRVGPLELAPGAAVRFCQMRWRAQRPGRYRLTFQLEWRPRQMVTFEPVMVVVGDPAIAESDTQLAALIEELATLGEGDEAVARRQALREELIAIGPSAAPAALTGLARELSPAAHLTLIQVLVAQGPSVVSVLVTGLEAAQASVRIGCTLAANELLARAADEQRPEIEPRIAPALAHRLRIDPDAELRLLVANTLGKCKSAMATAIPAWIDALGDDQLAVRSTAHRWLVAVGGEALPGFDPAATPDERSSARAAWATWWEQRSR
jgi:hypothetical protein